jgi:NADH dehydrogenase
MVHVSAIGADGNSPSLYGRSKAAAERAVLAAQPAATIMRPSILFGPEDDFFNRFAALARMSPALPLIGGGETRFQPVFVGDVASCIARALVDDETIGERYSLCGPKTYTLEELVSYVAQTSGHPRPIVPLGPGLANLQARVMELLPGPLLTRDNLASMQHDSVCEGPFPRAFDLTPTPLEAVAPEYLAPIALKSRFDTFRANSGR